ncbi:hypothetical protein SLS60_001767 [Paraconiothyrium brasiliense]|uniref:Uncharacterized protein n=1 Tax=Paraconiothyrium brasiliense TaxID=300254 RepID=A0ABR3S0G5_9PLEO
MLTKAIVALFAAAAVSAAPANKAARDDLQPWQITRLYTHTPSGNPGNDPHSILNFTISDPNTIPAGQTPTGQVVFPPTTAICSLQYLTSASAPWGVEQPCTTDNSTNAYSTWTFTLNYPNGGEASTNFDLVFKLVDHVQISGEEVTKTFTAGEHFEVGKNMGGQCGGSGVCSWNLQNLPYAVQQTQEDA